MVECELNFRYAWVLPGFAASVLGGVNGPIHITMTTTLSKLPEERQKKLFQHTSIILFLGGSVFAALVFIFAEFIIHAYAPG
nr:putative lipid II flippase MurJ isoform X4 [Ipomoea batatas]